jgi:hypothetical protein
MERDHNLNKETTQGTSASHNLGVNEHYNSEFLQHHLSAQETGKPKVSKIMRAALDKVAELKARKGTPGTRITMDTQKIPKVVELGDELG